ncbi:signal transduction histidine kinase [Candidatus Vecturithrix granuli]|uniref:Signal transduction histidine kinase n=1 Tax=Vecturithrix granuli TaxID=1499967 RepID=A0A081BU60_VECG1|nr:signal transduction histidine kinase [Candidatus Vecturithrix granuli]
MKRLKNLQIGAKLTIGFGILVLLMFVSVGVSYLSSKRATQNMNRIDEIRVPTALAASRAQANLLRMIGNVRGYLALGDQKYREGYLEYSQKFETDLIQLDTLSPYLDLENQGRVRDLKSIYESWTALPEGLFALHDDQLQREPAYRLLATEGLSRAHQVMNSINSLIDSQGEREPTADNMTLLWKMARFQGSFTAMVSALRGYVTTRYQEYHTEYEMYFRQNRDAWELLQNARMGLTVSQQEVFRSIEQEYNTFLPLPDQMFTILESDRWREDWYIFAQKAVPYADIMQQLLAEMTEDQETYLANDVMTGQQELGQASRHVLTNGIISLLLGIAMSLILQRHIAGPVRRLTEKADAIRAGALDTRAEVESGDEIGILAETFNNMTSQLRQTLNQVRKEKKRADDLLEVVIPLGVQLTSEKDFNRLLEKMLVEAQTFCHADAGTLYLRSEEDYLKFEIVRNTTKNLALGGTSGQAIPFAPLPIYRRISPEDSSELSYIVTQAVREGISSNIAQYHQTSTILDDYVIDSLLTIPLKNTAGQVRGVMQLLNAQDPETHEIIPFDQNLQQMMESFSLLAVAALEAYIREQNLRQEIQQLRIEIDEAKRQKQVREIVETETFQSLQAKAAEMRRRRDKRALKKDYKTMEDNTTKAQPQES